MKALFLFGPNLGSLAERDPAVYGGASLEDIMEGVGRAAEEVGRGVEWRQSDHEGQLVEWILGARAEGFDALVVNPGALTHYSYAIRDAIEASGLPALEVHLSNVFAREAFRRRSVVSEVCRGVIVGLGAGGYHVALEALPWITETEEAH